MLGSLDSHICGDSVFYRLQNENKLVDDSDHLDSFVRTFATHNVGHIFDAEKLHRTYSGFARSAGSIPLDLESFRDKLRIDKRVAYNSDRDVFYGIHVTIGEVGH